MINRDERIAWLKVEIREAVSPARYGVAMTKAKEEARDEAGAAWREAMKYGASGPSTKKAYNEVLAQAMDRAGDELLHYVDNLKAELAALEAMKEADKPVKKGTPSQSLTK